MSLLSQAAGYAMQGQCLDRAGLLKVIQESRSDPEELLVWSDKLRRRHFGQSVSLCSIVPGRIGACSEDCRWCAQSAHNQADVKPGITQQEHILQAGDESLQWNVSRFSIVNSGRGPTQSQFESAIDAFGRLRERLGPDVDLCASLGELDSSQAQDLRHAGVTRYHHNLETSERFFPELVGTHSYQDRLRTLDNARQAGMKLCCGGLLGVGETWEDRVDLALTLRERVKPQSVPLNFLHPISGTPLESRPLMEPVEALRCIAMFRLAMPQTDIRIAGGRTVTLRSLQSWMFRAGATGLMVGNYLTTTGATAEDDLQMIRDLGLSIGPGSCNPGNHPT